MRRIALLINSIFLSCWFVLPSHAQSLVTNNISGCANLTTTGKISVQCIPAFLAHIAKVIFGMTGGFALLMIMFAGYKIALGALTGDREGGKQQLKWAIIGFLVCAFCFFIIDFFIRAATTP